MPQKIDISTSTFVRLLLLLLAIWFAFIIREVFVLLFIVIIIVTALTPTVNRWAKLITRPGAVISVFTLLLIFLVAVFSLLIPPLVMQLQDFSANLPAYTDSFSHIQQGGIAQSLAITVRDNLSTLSDQLGNVGQLLFAKTVGVINGIVAVITIIILSFYLLLEEEGLKKMYKGLLSPEWHEALSETTRKIADKLGAWLRGQILIMFTVGLLVTIGLLIIGSPYALTLGLWSGLTEVIPIIGPWIGGVPGVIVGLSISPLAGFLALVIYLVVQQLENSFLVPRVMSRAVGLNPVIVIVALLIGDKLYGLLGVLLSVPFAAVIGVIAEDWPVIRQTFTRSQHSS